MPELYDDEFGQIDIVRSNFAHDIRLRCRSDRSISISLPRRTPLALAKKLLDKSRVRIRKTLATIPPAPKLEYKHGDLIGKSHYLHIEQRADDGVHKAYGHRITLGKLIVWHPFDPNPYELEHTIQKGAVAALRTQAKAHLSRRITFLADQHGLEYTKLRFSTASTRWGSCSGRGTISLTIWLMQLPFELIDYVLIHELCHTKQMNHSPNFWQLVAEKCPDYLQHRRELKHYKPALIGS